jgi:hypothetical protein
MPQPHRPRRSIRADLENGPGIGDAALEREAMNYAAEGSGSSTAARR